MSSYKLSKQATLDLDSIWDYTEETWNEEQAEKYTREIKLACERITEDTHSKLSASYIKPNYFKILSGSHVIFYNVQLNHIFIARILHKNMDFKRHL